MRLWFAPSSEVPIYRQLVTQVVLAILSGDVRPGNGFRAHANWRVALRSIPTRSARVIGNWNVKAGPNGAMGAVSMFASTPTRPPRRNRFWISRSLASFALLRALNLPAAVVRARLADWLIAPPPDHLLLIESDPEFRQILLTEIRAITTCAVEGVSLDDCIRPGILTAAIPLCRPSKVKVTRSALPAGVELLTLRIRSANTWIGPWLPSLSGKLIAVASAWPEFITTARTMLTALWCGPRDHHLSGCPQAPLEPRIGDGRTPSFATLTLLRSLPSPHQAKAYCLSPCWQTPCGRS